MSYTGSPVSEKPVCRKPSSENPRRVILGEERPTSQPKLALLYLLRLALEDLHQCVRNIGVVVHYLPFPLFTPVDVRHSPINTYRLVSERRFALFMAKGVGDIVGQG